MTAPGRLRRLFRRRRATTPVALVDDGSLVLLARAFEVERGDAAVLDEISAAGHDPGEPVLLRHVFEVHPAGDPEPLVQGLRADGFDVTTPAPTRLLASSTTVLTVLSTAQARARMTGLTTRYPVDYLGWEALGHPVNGPGGGPGLG
jgi:hypothetical protein